MIKIVPALILSLCMVMAQSTLSNAQDTKENETFIRTLLMSDAFGKSFAGDSYSFTNAKVDFTKKVKASGFLKANKAHMIEGSVLADNGKLMSGTLKYADPLGRTATYGYKISYKTLRDHHYKIKKVSIKTHEPLMPKAEGYFVPADSISLKKMKSMSTADLLRYARKNQDPLVENGQAGPVKDYHVLIFCMNRLRGNAKWSVLFDGKFSTSWAKGDWHVASIDASVSVNGPETDTFQVFYGPGKRSPFTKKLILAGIFSNQYLPMAGGPVKRVKASPATSQLLKKYHAKNLPDLRQ